MKKILIIEDETPVRENLVELLIAEGYQPIEAKDGEEGVSLAWDLLPDLILCDISMPKLDGYGVLSRISRDPATATIPFIFLTARVERDDLRRGMSLGADDYITKPFSIDEVLNAIETRLEKRASIQAQTEKKLAELSKSIHLSLPGEMLSPLSIIISTSEMIANRENEVNLDRSQITSIGQEIHHAAGLLLRSIQNYMLFSELDAIQADAERLKALRESRVFSAWTVITEMASLKGRQEDRYDDLELAVVDSPLAISEMYLQRIIEELLDHAFHSSLPGSKVELTGEASLDSGQYVLRIRDYGRGLPPEQVAALAGKLQPGSQMSDSFGRGIGMMIVKRLVELHLGSFNLQSQPKQSTTVEISLPLTE